MFMTTMPEQEHVCDITESVWTGFLDIPLERDSRPPTVCDCASSIRIEGAWNGEVVVACSHSLARQVALNMFHCPEDKLRNEYLADAMNEVANIIGGNIKSLLPSPSYLRLPRFHENWLPHAGGQHVAFSSGNNHLYVFLSEDV